MRNRLRIRLGMPVAALLAASVVLAGCGAGTRAAPAAAPAPVGTVSGGPGLTFTATTVNGKVFDASSLRGRPVALWFWAPWCTICRAEGPMVAKVAAAYAGRVTVLGVAGLGSVPRMKEFVTETGTGGFTHLADTTGAIWREYQVVSQPSFVFVRPDGQTDLFVGSLVESTLDTLMEATANAAGASPATTTGDDHVSDMMPLPSS